METKGRPDSLWGQDGFRPSEVLREEVGKDAQLGLSPAESPAHLVAMVSFTPSTGLALFDPGLCQD